VQDSLSGNLIMVAAIDPRTTMMTDVS